MWIIITNNSNLYTTFKNKKMENLFNISGKVIIITGGYGVLG